MSCSTKYSFLKFSQTIISHIEESERCQGGERSILDDCDLIVAQENRVYLCESLKCVWWDFIKLIES